jgi:hypothetical protein
MLVACVAVLCSVFLVLQAAHAEPADAVAVTATCGDRSAAAAPADSALEPGLEPVRRQ